MDALQSRGVAEYSIEWELAAEVRAKLVSVSNGRSMDYIGGHENISCLIEISEIIHHVATKMAGLRS